MAKSKSKAKVAKATEKKKVAEVAIEVKEEINEEAELDKALDDALDEAKKELEAKTDLDLEEKDQIDKEIEKVEEKMEVLGKVRTPVYQKSSFIKTKAYNTPVCLYELPEDIRTYLTNMWWWTNVYEKWEEWLVKHWADMDMIEKLKKFISEHYL